MNHRRIVLAVLLAIVLAWTTRTSTADSVLVQKGSAWKYLDQGSNQGTAWRAASFVDSGWPSGSAQLGYGDGDETTVVGFGPDANNKYVTTYFRRTFTVGDPTLFQSVTLNVLRDDGAVVYLNGTEVFRTNMPSGAIVYNTFASVAIGGPRNRRSTPRRSVPRFWRPGRTCWPWRFTRPTARARMSASTPS